MILNIFKRPVVSNGTAARICHALLNISAAIVMIFGIRRVAEMDLTESQVFVSTLAVMMTAGVFLVLGFAAATALRQKHDAVWW